MVKINQILDLFERNLLGTKAGISLGIDSNDNEEIYTVPGIYFH